MKILVSTETTHSHDPPIRNKIESILQKKSD